MTYENFTLLMIAIGLSMDAFAVSVTDGLCNSKLPGRQAFFIAFTFGLYQGAMTIGGYFLASTVSPYVSEIGNIIAFIILAVIGTKMIIEAIKDKDDMECVKILTFKELNMQGIATSIDALAIGMGFAALNVKIWSSSSVIASVTFLICLAGVYIGKRFGLLLKKKAVITGGILLIIIGIKLLLEYFL
ncbi:MAG: manganese efflux pump MntP family protein [Clostridia bacterium]|nr:manganese efflux pump MntP family protein [Clostridia bacterium]